MTNINTEGLPPEMQQRIAEIIEKAKANAVQPYAPAAPTQPAPVAAPGLQNPWRFSSTSTFTDGSHHCFAW